MTHSHGDHLDPETLAGYRAAGGTGPFLAPPETAEKLAAVGGPAGSDPDDLAEQNSHGRRPGDSRDVRDSVQRRRPDARWISGPQLPGAAAVYFTGDTAYHELLGISVGPHKPDVLVAVINPAFRNMGPIEAARLARELDVKIAIPCHYDMFPDNSLPPQLLRTNLIVEGIGERYRQLEHGKPFTFPETIT